MSDITLSAEIKVHAARCSMNDHDVMDAARVSTLGESTIHAATSTTQMRGLINFLMRDRHGTPFEHNSITFMVKAPIFVAREFMRHRADLPAAGDRARGGSDGGAVGRPHAVDPRGLQRSRPRRAVRHSNRKELK